MDEKWNLNNIPQKGHKDVGEFAWNLFEIAREEKERLGKPKDFLNNYSLYRGKTQNGKNTYYTPVNLYFANIERTVSNITAKAPEGEVVDIDGIKDGSEEILTSRIKKWWKDTRQQWITRKTARMMEIYGITIEKPYWDKGAHHPNVIVQDPFAFFPAPGLYEDISTESPYICYAYLENVDDVEARFGVKDVAPDKAYELLGRVREEFKADNYSDQQTIGNYESPMYRVKKSVPEKIERCLVVEVWVRDNREKTVKEEIPVLDDLGEPVLDESGAPLIEKITRKEKVYPDGVRKITVTKSKSTTENFIVLDDSPNPNINPSLERELAEKTHPWGRFPVYYANSYQDTVSIWGFPAAEQVGPLIVKINAIISKLFAYVKNVMTPPLIVQKYCGITKEQITNQLSKSGRLILMPTVPNARIEFMPVPNLPATFFNVLNLLVSFFDRVYQIEDADRGVAPKGVIAASAIVALQERNRVLMQTKTSAIDSLVEQRTRWAIGLWQNFGTQPELVDVNGEPGLFIGTRFAGRKYAYVVEAGSTTPRTSLQIQELAQGLYRENAIDRRALLETLNFPNWKNIVERMGESQLDAALQILIQAGLPQEQAIQLKQLLLEPQGGPGDTQQSNPIPPVKAATGKQPPTEVKEEVSQ